MSFFDITTCKPTSSKSAPDCCVLQVKFQKFSGGYTPKSLCGRGQPPPCTHPSTACIHCLRDRPLLAILTHINRATAVKWNVTPFFSLTTVRLTWAFNTVTLYMAFYGFEILHYVRNSSFVEASWYCGHLPLYPQVFSYHM
jgi:hypothetical protein